ncbi:Clavaminate synthase-like protein [Thalictrum thalictroides]|uniref:Clavaminate synthase-like protein n=1 Tax=Thalictrum thalictroides TaxID=46969 RepID=A0A7J6UV51_THATH|nr:Clavaminate synthase-like protein [Thalictrum thalictroides]
MLLKTLVPIQSSGSCSDEDLILGINKNRDWLCAILRHHGAVLFRGFNLQTGFDFHRVVEAFGWDDMDYVGASPRIKVTDRVYTANEAPLHLFIDFHHEMSLMRNLLVHFDRRRKCKGHIWTHGTDPNNARGEAVVQQHNICEDGKKPRLGEGSPIRPYLWK